MPLDKFVLILVCVIGAAAVTVWLAALVGASLAWPGGWLLLIPVVLVVYVLWRVIADRISSAEDDHYDHTPR